VASQRAATMGALTKFFRTLMQSMALGFAAFLVLENKLSPGMMIAATILLGKATAQWKWSLALGSSGVAW